MRRLRRRLWWSAAVLGLATCLTGADCDRENLVEALEDFLDDVSDDDDDDFFDDLWDDIEDAF